jgi:hypothetical protein
MEAALVAVTVTVAHAPHHNHALDTLTATSASSYGLGVSGHLDLPFISRHA